MIELPLVHSAQSPAMAGVWFFLLVCLPMIVGGIMIGLLLRRPKAPTYEVYCVGDDSDPPHMVQVTARSRDEAISLVAQDVFGMWVEDTELFLGKHIRTKDATHDAVINPFPEHRPHDA